MLSLGAATVTLGGKQNDEWGTPVLFPTLSESD
jgi:hypothetical protein